MAFIHVFYVEKFISHAYCSTSLFPYEAKGFRIQILCRSLWLVSDVIVRIIITVSLYLTSNHIKLFIDNLLCIDSFLRLLSIIVKGLQSYIAICFCTIYLMSLTTFHAFNC